ncbi:MAG: hypothetical protein JWM11_688, partial [Planctomycetaceae bacterium]|nr:hypothetical protein [Planctomycetaceae bacterium]
MDVERSVATLVLDANSWRIEIPVLT